VPAPIMCSAAGTAAFQLEFLTTGDTGTLAACTSTGKSTIPFSGARRDSCLVPRIEEDGAKTGQSTE